MMVVVGAMVAKSKVSEPEEGDEGTHPEERVAGMVSQVDGGKYIHTLEWLCAVY